jgi:hypothetical protein
MELKNFVDFAYSMINMDEVKDGVFPLPKKITFQLEENDHINVHKKIKKEKNDLDYGDLKTDFEVSVFDMVFKFTLNEK